MSGEIFDRLAKRYDDWFESDEGKIIFQIELDCLRKLIKVEHENWCEIGVGTGRFAQALGIKFGIDPSMNVLEFARQRGINVIQASSENLPFPNDSFDGLLMVVTLCFLDNPVASFYEAYRVLRKGGVLALGFVPADSEWGQKYIREAKEGHPFYSSAKFYTIDEARKIAEHAGLMCIGGRSCLFASPDNTINYESSIEGLISGAGFVAIKFSKK